MSHNQTSAICGGGESADLDIQALCLCSIFGETYASKLGTYIRAGGAGSSIKLNCSAHGVFSSSLAHCHGSMSQHELAVAVADCVNAGNICFKIVIYLNIAIILSNACIIKAELCSIGPATYANQDLFSIKGLLAVCTFNLDHCARATVCYRKNFASRENFHTLVL